MMDLIGRYRLMRAKRRWMRPPTPARYGALALVLALLAVAVVGVAIVERRGALREAAIVEYAAASRSSPVSVVTDLARTRPVVVLGDVAGASGPKRLAADVIEALARGPGLDWVALEIGADMQPYIDRYLDAAAEDASALMARPRALRGAGTAADYLGIYRRVRALNAELPVDRRIRIIAIDSPDWPPAGAVAPSRLVSQFAARDAHMMDVLMTRIFERDETARVFLFVDGLRALDAALHLAVGDADSTGVPLLTRRLRSALGARVGSVIVDAPGAATGNAWVGYRASRLDPLLRTTASGSALAFPLRAGFPGTTGDLDIAGPAGIDIALSPRVAPLASVANGYVRLPN